MQKDTGDWADFIALMDEGSFVFQFPAGPFEGRHESKDGPQKIRQWLAHNQEHRNRMTQNPRLVDGDWYLFADVADGEFSGKPYYSRRKIAFRIQSGRVVEYREYVGNLTDWP